MMHACADFIWIENVYQNLQNKFALKETQTKEDKEKHP
jgi:hypothetical protein